MAERSSVVDIAESMMASPILSPFVCSYTVPKKRLRSGGTSRRSWMFNWDPSTEKLQSF